MKSITAPAHGSGCSLAKSIEPPSSATWRIRRHAATARFAIGAHGSPLLVMITAGRSPASSRRNVHWIVEAAVRAGPYHWYAHNACLNYDAERTLRLLDA
ncbi:MAG: hypothetical protein AAFU70_05640, partial [Planctomycetota bacterium]